MALDTSASPTVVEGSRAKGGIPATITGTEADASTAVEIVAAPGVGNELLIDYVLITSDDADANPQLEDEDANLLFGPFHTTVEGVVVNKKFDRPIKVVTNKALNLKCAAAGNVSVWLEFRTRKAPA